MRQALKKPCRIIALTGIIVFLAVCLYVNIENYNNDKLVENRFMVSLILVEKKWLNEQGKPYVSIISTDQNYDDKYVFRTKTTYLPLASYELYDTIIVGATYDFAEISAAVPMKTARDENLLDSNYCLIVSDFGLLKDRLLVSSYCTVERLVSNATD